MFKVVSLAPPFYSVAKSAAAQLRLANWPGLLSSVGFFQGQHRQASKR